MKEIKCFLVGLCVIFTGVIQAQTGAISGVVVDERGEPLIGASILVRGMAVGTTSNIDGRFEVLTSEGTRLVVSYLGMQTAEISAVDNMVVQLLPDQSYDASLIPFGEITSTKQNLVSSVGVVNSEQIDKKNTTELTNALVGMVAGVHVVTPFGHPASNASLCIRGISSLNLRTSFCGRRYPVCRW